jgi:hypothetical protein
VKFFQYSNARICIRGNFDNVDFWNIVKSVFEAKGYKKINSHNGFIGDLAGCEFKSKAGPKFTFEYDDWGGLDLYPSRSRNKKLLDELNLIADEIENIGSNNPDSFYQDNHVSKRKYPERKRTIYAKSNKIMKLRGTLKKIILKIK